MTVSFQDSYGFNMPKGIPGRIADCGFKNTLSPRCLEDIPAAVGVMKPLNVDYQIMLPRVNSGSIAFSAPLILDNVYNVTVNGVAITPTTYATSNAATMQAIAAKIQAIPTVASAVVGGVGDNNITIVSNVGVATTITGSAVTGGVTQATATATVGQTGTFFGVTQEIYNKMNFFIPNVGVNAVVSSGTEMPYFRGQVAPTLTQGRIYVVPETLVNSNSAVYVRTVATGPNPQLGAFRGDADGGNAVLVSATYALWREGNDTIGDVAVLELNIP